MLLIWGNGSGRSLMGELPEEKCPDCGEKAPRTAFVDFKYWHIWYLFSFLTGREYHTACNACGAVAPYDKTEAKLQFSRDNIPFIRKNGWTVVAGLVALFLAFGAMSSREKRRKIEGMLAAPQNSDVYLADLSKVANSGYEQGGKKMYGAMVLVEKLEGGGFIVATSDNAFTKKSALSKAMKEGFTYSHDEEDPLILSREELSTLYRDGILFDGMRQTP